MNTEQNTTYTIVSDNVNYSYIVESTGEWGAKTGKCDEDGSFFVEPLGKIRLNGSLSIKVTKENTGSEDTDSEYIPHTKTKIWRGTHF